MTQGHRLSLLHTKDQITFKYRPAFNQPFDPALSPVPWRNEDACHSSEHVSALTCGEETILIYFPLLEGA